jgi:hypothetical protein
LIEVLQDILDFKKLACIIVLNYPKDWEDRTDSLNKFFFSNLLQERKVLLFAEILCGSIYMGRFDLAIQVWKRYSKFISI